jgi:hypothetical protein
MPVIPQAGLGRSAIELEVNRTNTRAFIEANLSLITLVRQIKTITGTGVKKTAVPRPTQQARLVDQTRTFDASPGKLTGADSTSRQLQYQLVMLWDAEVAKDDYWLDGETGERWDVKDLLPDNGYERRAEVMRYGEGP